jgi:hypothetical protein
MATANTKADRICDKAATGILKVLAEDVLQKKKTPDTVIKNVWYQHCEDCGMKDITRYHSCYYWNKYNCVNKYLENALKNLDVSGTEKCKPYQVLKIGEKDICNICLKEVKTHVPHEMCKPNHCGMCGSIDDVMYYKYAPCQYWYNSFCSPVWNSDKETYGSARRVILSDCYYKFGRFINSSGTDLRCGIPAIYKILFYGVLDFGDETQKEMLTCDFCGTQDNKRVIKCPHLPFTNDELFLDTTFCMNKRCAKGYQRYMSNDNHIPFSFKKHLIKKLESGNCSSSSSNNSSSSSSSSSNNAINFNQQDETKLPLILADLIKRDIERKIKLADERTELLFNYRFLFKEKERIKTNQKTQKESGEVKFL